MTTVTILIARVRAMLTRRRLEHELDEELRTHLELSTAEHIRRGLSPEAARARARRDRPADGVASGAGWSSANWRLPSSC